MLASGNYSVVLDACVLVPPALCDVLLTMAETPRLYRPKWSAEILSEAERNLPHATKLPPARIATWRKAVETAFPEAMVTGHLSFLDQCENHHDDRHVLAVAIREQASTIVTFNLRHFPAAALEPHHVDAVHPSDYLQTLYEHAPMVVVNKLSHLAARRRRTFDDFLTLISKTVPGFASTVRLDQQ